MTLCAPKLLFVIVNNAIHEIHGWLAHLEHLAHRVKPAIAFKEIVGHMVPATIVFHPQIFHMRIILWKTFGRCL